MFSILIHLIVAQTKEHANGHFGSILQIVFFAVFTFIYHKGFFQVKNRAIFYAPI